MTYSLVTGLQKHINMHKIKQILRIYRTFTLCLNKAILPHFGDFQSLVCSTCKMCQLLCCSDKAILHVFSAITKETLPIMGTVTLLRSFVSKLKSVVSLQLGIPVSSFRLSTGSHLHLYDCDLLSDYAVQAGKSHLQSPPITDTHTDIIQIKKYVWTMDGMLWMVTHYHQTFKSI
uniref:ATP-dependent DNA helicase RecQ zinc-binding domain-containing protein n=1 Tax=Cyprinus carpio carpio TaxID=630221 RepID=A0A8C1CDN4_CYPCA